MLLTLTKLSCVRLYIYVYIYIYISLSIVHSTVDLAQLTLRELVRCFRVFCGFTLYHCCNDHAIRTNQPVSGGLLIVYLTWRHLDLV